MASLWHFIFEEWCNVPSKSNTVSKKKIWKKPFFCWHYESHWRKEQDAERVRIHWPLISQRYGSGLYPYRNVTDLNTGFYYRGQRAIVPPGKRWIPPGAVLTTPTLYWPSPPTLPRPPGPPLGQGRDYCKSCAHEFNYFVTSLDFLSMKTYVNVPSKSKKPKNFQQKKTIFGWHLVSHRRKKQDPDSEGLCSPVP